MTCCLVCPEGKPRRGDEEEVKQGNREDSGRVGKLVEVNRGDIEILRKCSRRKRR